MCQNLQTNKRQSVTVDPSKQAGNRRRATENLNKRLRGAMGQVKALVDSIPVRLSVQNSLKANRNTYVWEMSPERQSQVDIRIRQIIDYWFQTQTPERPARWFFNTYIDNAVTPAVADSVNNIKLLSQGMVSTAQLDAVTVQSIFLQPQYRDVIGNIYGRVFNEMSGFSGDTATDLARVLSESVMLGESARKAKSRITKRFNVASSRAERIARTEINRAYTVARAKASQVVASNLDITVKLIHRSSLTLTTRFEHAQRHGKIYTVEEQNEWWSEGANRINCLCSINETVIGKDGKPRSRGLIEKLEKQRKAWAGG